MLEDADSRRSALALQFVDGAEDAIIAFDGQFRFLLVNPAAERLLGSRQIELVGRLGWGGFPALAGSLLEASLRQAMEERVPTSWENFNETLRRWHRVRATPLEDGGLLVRLRDVTGQKLAEEAVRAGGQRFSDVLDQLPAYLVLLSPDYHVPFANRFFRERFGESHGRRCYEYLFDRTEPCEVCGTYTVLKTNAPHRWEWTGPDGCDYDIYDFPFKDTDGSPLIMEVGLDITDRKRNEAELARYREQLEELVTKRTGQLEAANTRLQAEIAERTQAEEGIRHQQRVLEGINRIFQQALAAETEEELGRVCLAVAAEVTGSKFGFLGELNAQGRLDDVAVSDTGWEACRMKSAGKLYVPGGFEIHGLFGRVLLNGKGFFTNDPQSHPDRIGTPDGHPPLNSFLGAPLLHLGKPIGMIALANRDGGYGPQDLQALDALSVAVVQVFVRKRAERAVRETEERLRQAQKLESIGVLAGGIAHDFNNLLTGILGNASLLQMDATEDSELQLAAIIESSERAASLTRQLLAYAGKGQFQITDFDISRLVRSSADLLRVSTPRNIEVLLDVAHNLPVVRGDSSQIQQVVMNLVINAAESIEDRPDGKVSISTGVRELDAASAGRLGSGTTPGRVVWIAVSDNGCGMNEETKAKIFDPFFTTKFTGRGLGLAAVHGILRSHEGAISVASSPGQGSTFTVYLPCSAAPGDEPESAPATEPKPFRVLVVDDEEQVRGFTRNALGRLGYDVLVAGHGREALELLQTEGSVDLVLLDVVMPVMGGVEALAQLREKWPKTAVLVASGYSRDETARMGIPRDVPLIEKPYTLQRLGAAVEQVLQTHAFRGR